MSNAISCHYEPELLSRIQSEASIPGRSRLVAMRSIYEWHPDLEDIEESHEDSVLPLAGVYAALHWKLANGALFVVRNTLLRRLEHTDIEKGFSIRYLRAPYPDAFFHFEVPFRPRPGQGEDVSITGFYLTEQPWEAGGPSARLINISFSYHHQGEVLRFGTIDVSFYCTDESEEDLTGELKRRAESILGVAGTTNQADIDGVHEAVMLVAKILLYANMKSARRVDSLERTQLLAEIKGLKGNKRDKVAHKLKRAYDAILLGPEETDEDRLAISLTERMMPVHWRRGHYREQPFGPGRLQRKSIFIFPILVNASKTNEPPEHRPYSME